MAFSLARRGYKKTLTLMSGFSIIPPNCTDFQKSVSQRVLKISTWEKVR